MNLGLQLHKVIGLHCTCHPPHLPTQLFGLHFTQMIDAFLNFKLKWKITFTRKQNLVAISTGHTSKSLCLILSFSSNNLALLGIHTERNTETKPL